MRRAALVFRISLREEEPMPSPLGRIAFCFAVGALALACSQATDNVQVFQADLSGSNEVPVRATVATGTSQITVDGDTVFFSVQVNNINAVSLAHIHVAPAGTNGPVRVDFFLGPTTGPVNGILAQGSFTAADVKVISYDQLLADIRAGNTYVNVHSPTFPGGEIRGQLRAVN
jgi:hypothetical protein